MPNHKIMLPADSIAIAFCKKRFFENEAEMQVIVGYNGVLCDDARSEVELKDTGGSNDKSSRIFMPMPSGRKPSDIESMRDGFVQVRNEAASFSSRLMAWLEMKPAEFCEPPSASSSEKILVVWKDEESLRKRDMRKLLETLDTGYYALRGLRDLYYEGG